MKKFPIIHTERLILNRLELTDVPVIAKHCSNPKVYTYLLSVPTPYTEDDANWWVKNTWKKLRKVFNIILPSD